MEKGYDAVNENYFDNAATTPLDPRVLREMLPYLESDFGNANSLHARGQRARHAVELARQRVAELVGAEDPSQILFTSGATEANNWVVADFPDGAASPFEHSSMREPALRSNYRILNNDGYRLEIPDRRFELVTVMAVNNETGAIFDPLALRPMARNLHSDITQAVGKLPVTVQGLDFASMSAHKFNGPKGVGALFARNPNLAPMIVGGGQESGLRGGTLNVAGIVGMGAAAAIATEELDSVLARVTEMNRILQDEFASNDGIRILSPADASPYILSVSFYELEGESLTIEMDRQGFAVGAGAACSARSTEPSHVLTALGLAREWLRGTIRISLGKSNSAESTTNLAKSLLATAESLRRIR